MAALALVAGGVAVVLAVLLWWSRRRHAEKLKSVTRERDDAIRDREDVALAGERMRRALDALPLGVLMFDDRGSVVYRNRAAGVYTSGPRTEAMVTAMV